MDESYELLRKTTRQFVEKEILPSIEQWEENEEFPRELYLKAGAIGLLGLGFDEEFGGTPADVFHQIIFLEELSRSGSQGLVAGLSSHRIALPPLVEYGNPKVKKKIIPEVLDGTKIAALAVTEPNAGSDVSGIQTQAKETSDGYLLSGSKLFITSGCRADVLLVAARTKKGGTLFLVDKKHSPFQVSKKLKKMGWWASDTAEISFDECLVPKENLVGEEGRGFPILMKNFIMERINLAVMGYSSAQIALEQAILHSKNRVIFSAPLIEKQVIQHKLAKMFTKIDVTKSYVYSLAREIEEGSLSTGELSVRAAIAKNTAVEALEYVAREAVQIHGGMGYMRESLVERIYRDGKLLSIGGGTDEIMNEIIARKVVS